jgi:hypothetical protein
LDRLELIPGKSALWWAENAVRLLLSAMFLTLCMALLQATREVTPPGFTAILVPVVGILMTIVWPVALITNGLAFRRKFREYRAGYTTLIGDGREYLQVEPTSGWVIRAAGDALLSRSQWKAACERVLSERSQLPE